MSTSRIRVADGVEVGDGAPLLLIAGPDLIEDEAHALRMARALEPLDLEWLEADNFDATALAQLRQGTTTPVASCETLTGMRQLRLFLDHRAVDVALRVVDLDRTASVVHHPAENGLAAGRETKAHAPEVTFGLRRLRCLDGDGDDDRTVLRGEVLDLGGQPVRAERFSIRGELERDAWFGEDCILVRSATPMADGSWLNFDLQA